MNPRRKSRLYLAIVVLIGIALTATLMLYALRSNIDLFYTPGEILQGKGEIMRSPRSASAAHRRHGDAGLGETRSQYAAGQLQDLRRAARSA